MKTEQTNAKKYTLADAIKLGGSNRDICDDVFDCLNCFEYNEQPKDDFDRVLLWIAEGVEVLWGDKEVICCKLSQFIENHRRIFDAFFNEVYREEYQPKNNPVIEYESEEFYDYYIAAFFDIINGNFADEDYTTLINIINRPTLTEFEVRVQVLNQGEGMWHDCDKFDAARFDKMEAAHKHAQNLRRLVSETAASGVYRIVTNKDTDGEVVCANEQRVKIDRDAPVGFVVKDTITNTETGESLVYYTGSDGFPQDFPEWCEPYKVRGWAKRYIERTCADPFLGHNERTSENTYTESKKWNHVLEVVEVALKD